MEDRPKMLPCPWCGCEPQRSDHYTYIGDCRSFVVKCCNEACFARPCVTSQGPSSYGEVTDQCTNELARVESDRRWNVRVANDCEELIEILKAVSAWNSNPTLEPGLSGELQSRIDTILKRVM